MQLPPPEVIRNNSRPVIEQRFYKDPLFPDGFRYWLGCVTDQNGIEQVDTDVLKEARLLITSQPPLDFEELLNGFVEADRRLREGKVEYPEQKEYSGYIVVPVTTSSDEGGPKQEFEHICDCLKNDTEKVIRKWELENLDAAREFWSVSSVAIAEQTLENLWYENLHVCRCIYLT